MIRRPEPRTIRRTLAAPAAVFAVAALAAGCSSSKSSGASNSSAGAGASSAAASGNKVDVKNFSFQPGTLTVPVGTKVTWNFDDSTGHTVTATDGSFKSSTLSGGATYSFTFTKAGTFTYMCSIHTYMHGSVVVT